MKTLGPAVMGSILLGCATPGEGSGPSATIEEGPNAPLRLGEDAVPGFVPLQTYTPPPSSSQATDYAGVEGDYTGYDAIGMGLIGTWRSVDDPRAGLVVDYGTQGIVAAFTYDGEGEPFAPLSFADACEARTVAETGMVLIAIGEGAGTFCYALLRITPDSLVMSYLPRGNTLSYVRAD